MIRYPIRLSAAGPLVQRSGRRVFLLQEERQHLAAGVRPARIGVGAGLAPTGPGVAGSVKHPLLEDRTSARVSLDGAGVRGPTLRLPAVHGWAEIRPCLRLSDDLIAINRAHGRVAIAVEYDRGDRTPRPVARYASCPTLPHGGKRGGKVLGRTAGQARMHPDRGIQIRVGGTHDGCGRPTRREPGDIHALRINSVVVHDLARDARDDRGLTLIALLIARLEPVPALAVIG